MTDINTRALDRELKRGSAELLILSLLDARPRHGYELSKLIHTRSEGQLTFHIDSLYPLLYRLEERGWIKGTWVEKADERRRRFYNVTAEGRRWGVTSNVDTHVTRTGTRWSREPDGLRFGSAEGRVRAHRGGRFARQAAPRTF
jgi:PadR family transcriptional regulator PadR